METIFVGKPAMNIYLQLNDTLNEGDVFAVSSKVESVGNVCATCACLFKKWKLSAYFSGVVGNDGYAEKIRNVFGNYKVNVRYLETNFNIPTAANYIILNNKTGISSKILYNDISASVTKFKYDFMPDLGVVDGSDIPGALAFLNTYPSANTILYANVLDKELVAMSRRCTYVISTQSFLEAATKEVCDGSVENYVKIYQKIVDVTGKSNYIIILNNHKILYSVNGQVKMLPEAKMNMIDTSSFDSIFVGTFAYAFANKIDIDDAVKLANTAASLSLAKLGEVEAIPEIDDVLDNSGLREKLGMAKTVPHVIEAVNPTAIEPMNANQTSVNQTSVSEQPNENVNSTDIPQPNAVENKSANIENVNIENKEEGSNV